MTSLFAGLTPWVALIVVSCSSCAGDGGQDESESRKAKNPSDLPYATNRHQFGATYKIEPRNSVHSALLTPQAVPLSMNERRLSTIPERMTLFGDPVFSPDGARVAYHAMPESTVLKGQIAGAPKGTVVMLGDEAGKEYEALSIRPVSFSPDGRTCAYVAREAGANRAQFMVVEGREEERFDRVEKPTFSPCGKLAYAAQKDGRWLTIIGERRIEVPVEFEYVDSPVFSPVGNRFVYKAAGKDGCLLVSDAWRSNKYAVVDGPVFGPDGRTFAFRATHDGKQFVVVGEREGERFQETGYPRFTARRSVVYIAWGPERFSPPLLVIDGNVRRIEGLAKEPIFSPDGTRMAYVRIIDHKYVLVLDGEEQEPFDYVDWITFSPGGRRLAYVARDEALKKSFVVIDGKKGPEFDFVRGPVFNPDGSVVAYEAREGEKRFVVVGDKKSGTFDHVWTHTYANDGNHIRSSGFSPDGKKFAFGAQIGRELWWKVIELD